MAFGDEKHIENDPPEEEEEEDDEDEEDIPDPIDVKREECSSLSECQKLKTELEVCNERVNSRSNTEETCTQELYDFFHCTDHCVAKTLFSKLK
ncbi:cytochrome b-c1 complex subunit 6, mitochondrial-like [Saccoglossus kowalevskii]|uniref:Cytochrome b-c1 complex subunit 6 n=1 Tax=Saccoglossus kowalevskii TaxID=10224 RepID=A0ABM0GU23_SACKO|nr:PREDICTED: cytochrome b-c1 complex subunit 6, mitochondrial-like [Saccoglossus kowalevskii]